MNKIRIVNWLLTRKCNLKCDYCAITKNYKNKPSYYPDINHYIKNEIETPKIIETLKKLKSHNPNIFNIFYGGELMLRNNISEIIKFCNENEIHYTIISNNTDDVQPMIKKLINDVGVVNGFSSSVDPILHKNLKDDKVIKSIDGFKRLKEMQLSGKIKDVVAEITMMNNNKHLVHSLVSNLSDNEIYSSITAVDINKSEQYDFSNVYDTSLLVQPDFETARMFVNMLDDDSLLIHMKELIISKMFDILPSKLDCELEKNVHNITIDADGTIRLCLRMRGVHTPIAINVDNLFDGTGLNPKLQENINYDKMLYCRRCNHTCMIMSKHINDLEDGEDDLIHTDKRS